MLDHYKERLDIFQQVVVDNFQVLSTCADDMSRLSLAAENVRQFQSIFHDQDVEVSNVLTALNLQQPAQNEIVTHLPKKRSFTERDARSDEDAELLGSERSGESKRCRK